MVATEYGVANLKGKTVRERAQSLIDIAHPEDRKNLIDQAKAFKILYSDQIYLDQSGSLFPVDIDMRVTLKNDLITHIRAIRPSDEEDMRRLFYRFSDSTVYYRYFRRISTMPHSKMQHYVNVDPHAGLSIVALIGSSDQEKMIAEARYMKSITNPLWADIAFVVDENYQGRGLASKLYSILIKEAMKRGLKGFSADVLATNRSMMKVFEKGELHVKADLSEGVYELTMPFDSQKGLQSNPNS